MKVLKARLYDMKLQEEQQKYASQRKSAVGTGTVLNVLELIITHKVV